VLTMKPRLVSVLFAPADGSAGALCNI
jgi:hypothetical protein